MIGTLASQILSLPLPGWSQVPLQREKTEATGASAPLSPQLVPTKLGQKAPAARAPDSMSQTFSLPFPPTVSTYVLC